MMKPMHLLSHLAPFLAGTLLAVPAFSGDMTPTVLFVDPAADYVVNGERTIRAINGLAVNGESRMEHVPETRDLRPETLRLYLWVDVLGISSDEIKKKNMTRDQVMELFNAVDFEKVVPEQFGRNLCIDPATGKPIPGRTKNPQYWALEQCQAWEAKKNIVLHLTQPHPRDEKDFPFYCRYYNACVREVKKRFPDLGPLYVMIFNEPDFEYPRAWEKRGITESVAFFNQFHGVLEKHLKKEFPDVALIGPGISQFMNWGTWKNWTQPYLRAQPQADCFNCQPYVWRFSDLLAWTGMLQAESRRVNNRYVPLAATETNVDLGQPAEKWWLDEYHEQRVAREAATLFGMLANPNWFGMKHHFPPYGSNYFKWADMWFKHDGVNEPAPVYRLYWLFRDLKGTRTAAAADREDSSLRAIAARDGRTFTLALFNESSVPAKATLAMRRPVSGAEFEACEYLRYDAAAKKFLHGVEGTAAPVDLTFAPGEVKKMRWRLAASFAADKQVELKEEEFFSPQTGVTVREKEAPVDLPARPARGNEVVKLRLAFFIDDLLAVDRLNWKFNGREMTADFQAPTNKEQVILFVETALDPEIVKDANRLEFEPVTGTAYRLMFAALCFQPRPQSSPNFVRTNAHIRQPAPLAADLALPPVVEPGEMECRLQAANNTAKPIRATAALSLPDGWTLAQALPVLDVPAKKKVGLPLRVNVPVGQMRGSRFVAATLTSPGLPDAVVRRGTAYHVPFQAAYAAVPPTLDGRLDEWEASAFVETALSGPELKQPYRTRLACRWDEKYLYAALTVEGRPLMAVPAGDHPRDYDTFELFLDFFNSKKTQRDHRTMQTWVSLRNSDTNAARWENVPNDPNGALLKGESPKTYEVKVVDQADGFTMEAKFDWEALTANKWLPANERFRPAPGMTLGCEAALAGRSLLGSKDKSWPTPSQWGLVRLLAKGEKTTMPAAMIRFDSGQAGAGQVELEFRNDKTAGWTYPSEAKLDAAGLHLTNHHWILLQEKGVNGVMTTDGLGITFTIGGFDKTTADPGKMNTEARVFLTPLPLAGFIEPYLLGDVLTLWINYREGEDLNLRLSTKIQEKEGMGRTLWSGSVPAGDFPLTVSLWLNADTYRIVCDRETTSIEGSRSGRHLLPKDIWSAPVRCGIKSLRTESAAPLGDLLIPSVKIGKGRMELGEK